MIKINVIVPFDNRVIDLYKKLQSTREVGKVVGCSKFKITEVLKRNKIQMVIPCKDRPKQKCIYCDGISWSRHMCKNHYNQYLVFANEEYREKQYENCRFWTDNNPNKVKESKKKYSLKPKENPDHKYEKSIKARFGLTKKNYDEMLLKQNNKCAICNKDISENKGKRFHIDHDHKTNTIRGLLCFRCNFGIGWFQENIEKFESALAYLKWPPNKIKIEKEIKTRESNSNKICIGVIKNDGLV